MRILCTNHSLINRGGSESYLETIAPALRNLGHDVEFFSLHAGPFADDLRAVGFTVHDDAAHLGPAYDVIHAQHASAALAARAALPDTPMVFASHSWYLEIENPPNGIGIAALIGLNESVVGNLSAMELAAHAPIHRLTQPITVSGFEGRRVPIREVPRRAVVVSRRLRQRMAPLEAACAALNIELVRVGDPANDVDPTMAVMASDIVIGAGRSALEGMAMGRAVFVFEEAGVGGWVDETSYTRLEPRGFVPDGDISVDGLAEQLTFYDRRLGSLSRELVVQHHDANRHAVQLVEIYRAAGASFVPPTDAAELNHRSVLNQRLFALEARARTSEWEAVRLQYDIADLRTQLAARQAELDDLRSSRSWRITAPLRRFRRKG